MRSGETNISQSQSVGEGRIAVTGGRIWYRIVGADKPGIPLLALHGGPGGTHFYLEPLEALADERPVIFYDQLGCGNSDRPDDLSLWTVERFVDELAQVRQELRLEKVHILGQSWGSMLAVDYLLSKKPAGVVSLVFSGPCLSAARWQQDQWNHIAKLPEPIRKTIQQCEASGTFDSRAYQDAVMEFYRRHLCRMDPWPDCLNRAFENVGQAVYEHMWGPSEFTLTGTLKTYERAARLKEIAVPVIFTCGRYDEAAPETVAEFCRLLPGSEMMVFEDASHEHHIEQAERYMQVVRDFLRRAEQ